MSLTETIKAESHRLGFALAGVTTPDPPPHWQVFQNWLALGRHASMAYLEDPRRADPRLVFPGCKSILVLAMPYPRPRKDWTDEPVLSGMVASYAWNLDYHSVLARRLKQLVEFIELQVGRAIDYRAYVDTGPLLERDLAQRAGLGWIGKNTCLINLHLGSCLFLSELLLDLDLEVDPPFTADRCGTCQRCLDACPTGCILPDRTLDARRCISYLTIENKDQIPEELRSLMGNWIFGCDLCQSVCPWNQKGSPQPPPEFLLSASISRIDIAKEAGIASQEFNQKYKDSPILRARRKGFLRNVAVALGNSRSDAAIPALERLAIHDLPLVRDHARWALDWISKNTPDTSHLNDPKEDNAESFDRHQ